MPKGQDRYANRARKRTPRSGQTIRIGKTIGVAPLVGEYDDVCRWLKDLVTDGLSLRTLQRLGRWCVLMAEAEGFPPATDVSPTVQRMLDLSLHHQGILPAYGEPDFKPKECFRLDPESPFQRWQREADEWDLKCLHVEEIEAAFNLARKYKVHEFLPGLKKLYDPEKTERIKRERYNFTLKHLDVLNATYGQPFLHQPEKERKRMSRWYGPQTSEEAKRRAELDREFGSHESVSKRQNRREGRLVDPVMCSQGWSDHGIYATVRQRVQEKGHQLAEDE